MLIAAKDMEEFLHKGALAIKAVSVCQALPPAHIQWQNMLALLGLGKAHEGQIPYIPAYATHCLAPSASSSCCILHRWGEFGQHSRREKDPKMDQSCALLHMSQTHRRPHTALKHCLRCWDRCSKASEPKNLSPSTANCAWI